MIVKTIFSCQKCDAQTLKWAGRCSECGGWGTFVEEVKSQKSKVKSDGFAANPGKVLSLDEISSNHEKHFATGIGEFDRVLGGGFVAGSIILLAGEPGIGKSTLVAQIAASYSSSEQSESRSSLNNGSSRLRSNNNVPSPEDNKKQLNTKRYTLNPILYVSGEESPEQLKGRFQKLEITNPNISILSDTTAEVIAATVETIKPALVIVDSIQTISSEQTINSGLVAKMQSSLAILRETAKKTNIPFVLIGQVTKALDIAGPKSLEHLVDIVLTFEGDRYGAYRLLRSVKNRFGASDELGIFAMTEFGLKEVLNPSAAFLENRSQSAGGVVTCLLEGMRPILIEIQALANRSRFPYPERRAAGFDANRLNMLLAVLEKTTGKSLANLDIHINVTSGFRIKEPAADLAVILAIASSIKNQPIPKNTAAFGEVGLGGELRAVRESARRINEAKKINFETVLMPCDSSIKEKTTGTIQCAGLKEALSFLSLN